MITRYAVAKKNNDFLTHKISKEELVDWADNALNNSEYEEKYFEQINAAVSRIGLADVKNFTRSWEDYESILNSLGFSIQVENFKGHLIELFI